MKHPLFSGVFTRNDQHWSIDEQLAGSLNWTLGSFQITPEMSRVLGKDNGRSRWRAGDRLVQKDLAQTLHQPIADVVSKGVGDVFETVQVEKHERQPSVRTFGLCHGLLRTIAKQVAVWKAGELVVVRQMTDAILGHRALGDIATVQHDSAHRRMLEAVVACDLQHAPGAATVEEACQNRPLARKRLRHAFQFLLDLA